MCSKCPWPMEQTSYTNFKRYLQSKKETVDCYPYEKFCQICINTWLKNGKLCLEHGHEFNLQESTEDCCLVFFDGYKSCYHEQKQYLVRGQNLETLDGKIIAQGFANCPFGKKKIN